MPPQVRRETRFRGPTLNLVLSGDNNLIMRGITKDIRSGEVTPTKANNSLETAPATTTATTQSPAPAPSSPGADGVGEAKQGPAPS